MVGIVCKVGWGMWAVSASDAVTWDLTTVASVYRKMASTASVVFRRQMLVGAFIHSTDRYVHP